MKKLAAILLTGLFIFNLFGYRILFYFAQQQSDIDIVKSLDNNQYNEEDLITLKFPISVPYQVEQRAFERFDGEVSLNGRIYKFVKRKISGGNLILLCLPDRNKMHLETAKNDLARNSNDLQNTGSKKTGNSKPDAGKNLSSEYNQNIAEYRIAFNSLLHKPGCLYQASPLSFAPHSSPEQPPELA